MSISTDTYGDYSSVVATTSGFLGVFLVVYIILMIICLAISVLMIVSLWKIFHKNNKPGWYSLIPFLNMWTLFEIVGVQGWWSLIPVANIVFMYICNYKLAIKMGKSQGMAVVTTLFPAIGYPILAFSKNKDNNQVVTNNINVDNQVVSGVNQTINTIPTVTPITQDVNSVVSVTSENTQVIVPGQQISPQAQTGVSVPTSAFCPNCGAQVNPDSVFCAGCGKKLK